MNIAEIEALLGKSVEDEWYLPSNDPYQRGYIHVNKNGRPLVRMETAARDELQLAAAAPDLARELIVVKKLLGRVGLALDCYTGNKAATITYLHDARNLVAEAKKASR